MNSLFMPREQEGRDLLSIQKINSSKEQIIVFSSVDRLFYVPDFASEPVMFKDCSQISSAAAVRTIGALCFHDGSLYNSLDFDIFEDLDEIPIASRFGLVSDLVSHNGCLYDTGDYRVVYETLERKHVKSFNPLITQLVSHQGKLLAVCEGSVFYLETGGMEEAGKTFTSACSLDGELYFATKTDQDAVFYQSKHAKRGGSRSDSNVKLFVYGDWVYDVSCNKGLIQTCFDDGFSYEAGMIVDAITAVPKDALEDMLRK